MRIFESLVRDYGVTIIMVTHERAFAERATRQLLMRDGRIVGDIVQTVQRDPSRILPR
jgi:predicted ABC-type transport system involved in lysophospholipase L1 biosynthesis ATPase subunit